MQVVKQRTATVPIDSIRPSPENVNQGDVGAISQSIEANAWFGSVVAQESSGTIIAGEHRWRAAKALGAREIPVTYADVDDDRARRIRLADNRTARLSSDDPARLAQLLQELAGTSNGLDGTGFDGDALDELLADLGQMQPQMQGDPDAVPEVPAEPMTRRGDLWVLGEHRLLCGDSTAVADVQRLLAGVHPDVLLTDPPYCSGGFQEAGRKAGSVGTRGDEMVHNDTLSTRGYAALLKGVLSLVDAGVLYIFTDWRMWVNLFDVAESSGYGVRNMVVWDKGTPGMGRGWRSQHELILCGMKVTQPFDPHKAQGNVIRCDRTGNILHPTQKPVDLLSAILAVTDMARTVYDPFSGAGSTLMACAQMGRTCYAMEIDPAYCDVICQRFKDLTGIEPIRQSTARDLEQVTDDARVLTRA